MSARSGAAAGPVAGRPAAGSAPGPEEALPLVFFGTLMDREVLSLVVGRAVEAGELEPVHLPGFRRVRAAGASYPVLVAEPAGAVEGRLWRGARPAERARLDAYEGPAYRLAPVEALDAGGNSLRALAYLAVPGRIAATAEPWDLAAWQARHKAAFLARGEALVGSVLP